MKTTGRRVAGALAALLTDPQAQTLAPMEATVTSIIGAIVDIRTQISRQLRKDQSGGAADSAAVLSLSRRYGELDGRLSYLLAQTFASIAKTLTPAQQAAMVKLRDQDVFPPGVYRYSDPMPTGIDASSLFAS